MGKKQSLAESKMKKTKKYLERRKLNPKDDMAFPATSEEMQKRVCYTEEEVDRAVEIHLQKADAEGERNGAYWIVLDNENYVMDRSCARRNDLPSFWSWHEQSLIANGASREEMERRKEQQKNLRSSWSKLSQAEKAAGFWTWRERMKEVGVVPGSVMGFSVAAVDDYEGEHIFAVHCKRLIDGEYGGKPRMPESIKRLLTHPFVRVINVGVYGDLEELINSFFLEEESLDVWCVEAVDFFRAAWEEEEDWLASLLDIVERANPGKTIKKNPSITLSHWWEFIWHLNQIHYILSDTFFLAQAIARVFDQRLKFNIHEFMYCFPDKHVTHNKRDGFYQILSTNTTPAQKPEEENADVANSSATTDSRQFCKEESEMAEDLDDELLAGGGVVEVNLEQIEAEPEVETQMEVPVSEEERNMDENEKEEEGGKDEIRGMDDLPTEQTDGRVVLLREDGGATSAQLSARPAGSEYHSVDEVSDEDEFDRQTPNFAGKRARPAAPYTTVWAATSIETIIRTRSDNPVWPKEDEVETYKLSNKNRGMLGTHINFLENHYNKPRLMEKVAEIEESQRPEFFASLGTHKQMSSRRRHAFKEALTRVSVLWSLPEKRRFLKKVAAKLCNFEFPTWARMVEIGELDPIMFACSQSAIVVELARADPAKVPELLKQLSQLYRKGEDAKRDCIRASRYYCPFLESCLLKKFSDSNLKLNMIAICDEFQIPFPASLKYDDVIKLTSQWANALSKGEISERDFVTLADRFVLDDERLQESLLTHALRHRRPHRLLVCFYGRQRPSMEGFDEELPCWTKRDAEHLRSWEIADVREDAVLQEVKAKLVGTPSVALVYRVTNDASYSPAFAAFMIMFADSPKKFLWRCLTPSDEGRKAVGKQLMLSKIASVHPNELRRLLVARFGTIEGEIGVAKKAPTTPELAKKGREMGQPFCPGTKLRPVLIDEDVDECVVHHMAQELELLKAASV